jgi:hypothetical protein
VIIDLDKLDGINRMAIMKTNITVSWARVVEVDVDPALLILKGDEYMDEVRNKAVEAAGAEINWKDGIVTDCEDFPQLAE